MAQQERGEVIDRQRGLDAVNGDPPSGIDCPGVVDDHVETVVALADLTCQRPHVALAGQVTDTAG